MAHLSPVHKTPIKSPSKGRRSSREPEITDLTLTLQGPPSKGRRASRETHDQPARATSLGRLPHVAAPNDSSESPQLNSWKAWADYYKSSPLPEPQQQQPSPVHFWRERQAAPQMAQSPLRIQ